MKKFLLALLLLNLSASAQTIFERTWISDFNFLVTDVAIDDEGNAYFACSGNNAAVDSSVFVVVKTNSDFDILWSNWYQTYIRDDAGSIEILEDGNILLGGAMRQSFAPDEGGGLIKINPEGEVIWKRVVSGAFDERVIYTNEEPGGNILSVIRYGVSGQPSSVLLTSADGEPESYFQLFADGEGLQVEAVVATDNNSYYATGGIVDSGVGYNVIFIAHFTNEEVLWFRKYDLGEPAQASLIATNADGDLAISGFISDPASAFSGNNAVLLRTNSLGGDIDAKRFFRQNNSLSEFATGLILQDDGTVIISFFLQNDTGGNTIWAEFGADGTQNWISAIETGEGASTNLRSELGDGRSLLAGRNFNGDIVLTAAISDPGEFACNNAPAEIDVEDITPGEVLGELVFSIDGVSIVELPIEVTPWQMEENIVCSFTVSTEENKQIPIKLFPNPVQDQLFIETPAEITQLEIYSMDGRKIRARKMTDGVDDIDVSDLLPGVYILRLAGKSSFFSRKITIL